MGTCVCVCVRKGRILLMFTNPFLPRVFAFSFGCFFGNWLDCFHRISPNMMPSEIVYFKCSSSTLRRRRAKDRVVKMDDVFLTFHRGGGRITFPKSTGKKKRQRSAKRWQRRAGMEIQGRTGRTKEREKKSYCLVFCHISHPTQFRLRIKSRMMGRSESSTWTVFRYIWTPHDPTTQHSDTSSIWTLTLLQTYIVSLFSVSARVTSYNFIFSFVLLLLPLFTAQQNTSFPI